jgi:hypothetical protein
MPSSRRQPRIWEYRSRGRDQLAALLIKLVM